MDKRYTLCVELKSKSGTWRRHVVSLQQLEEWLDKYILNEEQSDEQGSRFYVEPHRPEHTDGELTTKGPFQ